MFSFVKNDIEMGSYGQEDSRVLLVHRVLSLARGAPQRSRRHRLGRGKNDATLAMRLPLGLAATLAASLGAHGFTSSRVAGSRSWRVNHASPTDFLSGITGFAPSSLKPTPKLLEGTSIDPARDDVKLERVYKASKDGWR